MPGDLNSDSLLISEASDTDFPSLYPGITHIGWVGKGNACNDEAILDILSGSVQLWMLPCIPVAAKGLTGREESCHCGLPGLMGTYWCWQCIPNHMGQLSPPGKLRRLDLQGE